MDEIRGSVSRLKKKLKHQLTGSKRESGGTGAGVYGESVDPAGPLPQAEPPFVAGGHHDRDENVANADGWRVSPTDRPQQPDEPESVPAHGSENDQERSGRSRDADDGKGKKVERDHPSPSTASIPHSGTPGGTWAWLFWLLSLIIPPDNVDTSAGPGRITAVPRPGESAEQSAVADEDEPSWESTGWEYTNWGSAASATAKLLLREVRDSADAFPPLKSVAGGLCFILENSEVRPSSTSTIHNAYGCPQQIEANKQAIRSLAPRVKTLAELLCAPISEGDVEERERTTRLER